MFLYAWFSFFLWKSHISLCQELWCCCFFREVWRQTYPKEYAKPYPNQNRISNQEPVQFGSYFAKTVSKPKIKYLNRFGYNFGSCEHYPNCKHPYKQLNKVVKRTESYGTLWMGLYFRDQRCMLVLPSYLITKVSRRSYKIFEGINDSFIRQV